MHQPLKGNAGDRAARALGGPGLKVWLQSPAAFSWGSRTDCSALQESAEPPELTRRTCRLSGKVALRLTRWRIWRRAGSSCCPHPGLVAPSGTPLPLMLKSHPSCALRGYDSGKGVHFAQPPGLMQPFSIPVQITLQGGRRRQGR